MVSRQDGGSGTNRPYVALENVARGDVAPDHASNTKWLVLGLAAGQRPVSDDAILDLVKTSRVAGDRGKFLGISASDENALDLLDAPSGGGSGRTESQVNAQVRAIVEDWAEVSNATLIPLAKLGNINDDLVLDLAQSSRGQADRNKILATSATNENNLVLVDMPSGGGGGLNQSQVDARIVAVVNDDFILDLAEAARASTDRGKLLGIASGNENALALFDPGVTLDQATDAAGRLLNNLAQFGYSSSANFLRFNDNSITAAQARATSGEHKAEWIARLGVDDRIHTWARAGNADLIPVAKLPTAATEGLNISEVDTRIRILTTDDRILDLAQSSRAAADRGKVLGTSTTNENEMALLDRVTLVEYADQAAAEGARVGANVIQYWPAS